jgi:hypothetical protein
MVNRSSDSSGDAKATAKSGLLKPQFAEDSAPGQEKAPIRDSLKTMSGASPERTVREVSQALEQRPEETSRQEAREKKTPQSVAAKLSEAVEPETRKEPPRSSSKDPSLPEGPLKKFDHAKYFDQLRSDAVELVKKESNSSHAILCRDTITDEWSLSIYRIKDNYFAYVVYVWDEIDEKWTKTHDSERRPLTQMKDHLRLSVVHKECKALKGTIP